MLGRRLITIALAIFSSIGAARADPKSGERAPEYRSVYRGIIFQGGFETGAYGQAVPGLAGAETTGIKTLADRQLLVSWDAASGVIGGYGGNEHPGFLFVGGRFDVKGELGYRFLPTRSLSPYGGAGGQFEFSAVSVPSAPAGGPNAANRLDGLAGETGSLKTRCAAGGSYLEDRHALVLTAFAQESLRPKGTWATTALYYELGIHLQYEMSHSLSLIAEALYGKTAKKSDGTFGSTTEANYEEATIIARKALGKGFWLALDGKVARPGDTTTYSGSSIAYVTSGPFSLAGSLTLGVPIE